MKIKFSYIMSILCLGIMTLLPMERTLAQGRGGGRGHATTGIRGGGHIRGPQFGLVRNRVPRGARFVGFRGETYHWHNGVYYHPHGKKFIVVRPPIGLRIGLLPLNYFTLTVGMIPYYYYYGTFYTSSNGEYEVVDPPVGAVVGELPNDCEEVTIDGKVYYKVDGTYYKAVVDDKNHVMYEVVGKLVK